MSYLLAQTAGESASLTGEGVLGLVVVIGAFLIIRALLPDGSGGKKK